MPETDLFRPWATKAAHSRRPAQQSDARLGSTTLPLLWFSRHELPVASLQGGRAQHDLLCSTCSDCVALVFMPGSQGRDRPAPLRRRPTGTALDGLPSTQPPRVGLLASARRVTGLGHVWARSQWTRSGLAQTRQDRGGLFDGDLPAARKLGSHLIDQCAGGARCDGDRPGMQRHMSVLDALCSQGPQRG